MSRGARAVLELAGLACLVVGAYTLASWPGAMVALGLWLSTRPDR